MTLEYRVDGGAWTAYTAPFQVDGAGSHTVEYRATDAAGNVSAVASKTFTITARSDSEQPIVGNVPATLSVTLGTPPSFGTFVPNVGRDYLASTVATVTSTAGDATLSVADRSATNTGKLVNGSYALAQPLQIRAGDGRLRAARRQREPDAAGAVRRAGQRHERADRAQADDRRHRGPADRGVHQDADVHAVDDDTVS